MGLVEDLKVEEEEADNISIMLLSIMAESLKNNVDKILRDQSHDNFKRNSWMESN